MITADNDIARPSINTSFTGNDFEASYIALRKKENRIYTDDQVASLPTIDRSHIHYNEWQLRKRSFNRLFNYLQNKNKPISILEIGCGNGWLVAKMATIKNAIVTGIDINSIELEQARKVFGHKPNLFFLETDITNRDLDNRKFDVIIFAASIQYFPSVEEIIGHTLSLLNNNGEVHILDSHFYHTSEIENAAKRTLSYYRSIGHEKMSQYYFHHSIDSLRIFNYTLLFDPSTIINKLFRKKDVFPWIMISK